MFNHTLKDNLLLDRQDLEKAVIELVTPVYNTMSFQQTPGRFHLSDSGSVYSAAKRDIEGFLRTLWALGPLFSHAEKTRQYTALFQQANQGILAGTDPKSPHYWGLLEDYDQLFVEMGALATYLILTKTRFWDRLSPAEQQAIFHWLDQINHHTIPQTNWLFFRVLVNTFFQNAQQPVSEKQLREDLENLDSYYLADGWYYDGYRDQIDYYIPFGMQYYGLLFTKLTPDTANPFIQKFRQRGAEFAKTFKNWFVTDGAALPFGRSLTYRFAQSAYWAAAIFADIPLQEVSLKEAKYLLLANMRSWFKQPIFTAEGYLSIGYAYPNLVMAEGYNAPGSPYWALKNFILLALPEEHPFWQTTEKIPDFAEKERNPYSRMLLLHGAHGRELQAFTVGQHAHEHAHGEAKYEKYVYSTTFGFSVAKGSVLAKQGAFDNTLAISETPDHYRTVFGYQEHAVHEDYLYGKWQPWPAVTIKAFIIPLYPWHVRLHLIESDRSLYVINGGFSAPAYGKQLPSTISNSLFYQSTVGISGVAALSGQLTPALTQPEPNTNLLFEKTELPLLSGKIVAGTTQLITLYLGDAFAEKSSIEEDITATLTEDMLQIKIGTHATTIRLKELAQ